MTQSWISKCLRLGLANCLAVGAALAYSKDDTLAQVKSDSTLGAERSVVTAKVVINGVPSDRIDGGAIRDANLFHSFQEFNVGEGRGIYFTPPAKVQNVLTRVTGNDPSRIFGKLGVSGSDANLFLINPNGIIFGSKASLDVGGSFVATTANAIGFSNQGFFSASAPNVPSLLTVNPSALLFNQIAAGSIINTSTEPVGQRLDPFQPSGVRNLFGLQVPDGRSLLLVGGNVSLDGSGLNALGGRVELGGVAGAGTVGLNVSTNNLRLSFPDGVGLADVSLTNGARVDASGEGGGDVQVHGRDITLTDGSQIVANTLKDKRGGNLTLTASNSVELRGTLPDGILSSFTLGAGDAGDITITTGKLIVRDGAQVSTFTLGEGSGGQLSVNASESVELIGTSPTNENSGLFSAAVDAGKAGNITIKTAKLLVRDGAFISTESAGLDFGTFIPAEGAGGNLTAIASESVQVFGTSPTGVTSGLSTGTSGTAAAGNLRIETGELFVQDRAEVTVSSQGLGNAGNLEVTTGSTRLENGGKLRATSAVGRGGGNIKLNALNLLLLRGNSEISTNAEGEGNGGDIMLDADLLIGLEDSDITANAIKGRGGNIQINAQGIFGIEPRSQRTPQSDITASSDLGIDGMVEINRPDVDPSAELVVLPAQVVDVSGLIAQGCAAGRGNVAGGSEFVITGRGGLPPTPTEATRSDPVLADLGSLVQNQENRVSAAIPLKSTVSEPDTLVEAQGWVIGSKGEVVLTAAAITPDIPWLTHNSCNGS